MKILSQLFLLAAAVALVIAVIIALVGVDATFLNVAANGWLDLSLVCAVFSIAIIAVFKPGATGTPAP